MDLFLYAFDDDDNDLCHIFVPTLYCLPYGFLHQSCNTTHHILSGLLPWPAADTCLLLLLLTHACLLLLLLLLLCHSGQIARRRWHRRQEPGGWWTS